MASEATSAASADQAKSTSEVSESKPVFTEKEERVLKIIWRCFKSGPPEIDIEKLVKYGGFNTQKTATNTWGVLKKKLFANAEAGGEVEQGAVPASPKTPMKSSAKKRRSKKTDLDGEDGEEDFASPQKKPRKTPVKRGRKTAKKDEIDDADADVEAEGVSDVEPKKEDEGVVMEE